MQKVVQRTAAAKRQAARKIEQQRVRISKADEFRARQDLFHRQRIEAGYFKQEKQRRREQYEVGPTLAPRHDVGANSETYGTVDAALVQPPQVAWSTYQHFVSPFDEGDRVLVTTGRDCGKIARITSVNHEAGTVRLNNIRMVDFYNPEYMRLEDSDPTPITHYPLPVPWDDLKLVYPLRDYNTGHFEDTVVDKLIIKQGGWSKKTREYKRGQRYLPGIKEPIPWPKKEDVPKNEGYDDDTLRIDVDDVTHRPYLLQPPMPPSVIDELRNKYSMFRDRHDPEYIAAKNAQDRAAERKAHISRIVSTPLAELKEKRRQERLTQPPTLSNQQLEKIGAIMAQERLNAVKNLSQGQQ